MDFKITSTKKGQRGMSMVELMVATVLGSVVALGIASLIFYTGRSFAAMANYVDLDNQSRIALDRISQEVRQARRLVDATPSSLTFEDADGGSLSFVYNPDSKTLQRIKDGLADSNPLLEECVYLQFSIFQRNPINGVYDQYPAATADTCKLVQLHWICRRTTLGTIVNTESVQSAKVVIRKQ